MNTQTTEKMSRQIPAASIIEAPATGKPAILVKSGDLLARFFVRGAMTENDIFFDGKMASKEALEHARSLFERLWSELAKGWHTPWTYSFLRGTIARELTQHRFNRLQAKRPLPPLPVKEDGKPRRMTAEEAHVRDDHRYAICYETVRYRVDRVLGRHAYYHMSAEDIVPSMRSRAGWATRRSAPKTKGLEVAESVLKAAPKKEAKPKEPSLKTKARTTHVGDLAKKLAENPNLANDLPSIKPALEGTELIELEGNEKLTKGPRQQGKKGKPRLAPAAGLPSSKRKAQQQAQANAA